MFLTGSKFFDRSVRRLRRNMHSVECGPAGREEPTELMKTTQMLALANLIILPALCVCVCSFFFGLDIHAILHKQFGTFGTFMIGK